jgi:hypothetical protein
MNAITIISAGYFDTAHEYKVALLREGQLLNVLADQLPAPCRGKRGRGVWCASELRPVFVDDGCFIWEAQS